MGVRNRGKHCHDRPGGRVHGRVVVRVGPDRRGAVCGDVLRAAARPHNAPGARGRGGLGHGHGAAGGGAAPVDARCLPRRPRRTARPPLCMDGLCAAFPLRCELYGRVHGRGRPFASSGRMSPLRSPAKFCTELDRTSGESGKCKLVVARPAVGLVGWVHALRVFSLYRLVPCLCGGRWPAGFARTQMPVQTDGKNCGFFIPLFARKLAYVRVGLEHRHPGDRQRAARHCESVCTCNSHAHGDHVRGTEWSGPTGATWAKRWSTRGRHEGMASSRRPGCMACNL